MRIGRKGTAFAAVCVFCFAALRVVGVEVRLVWESSQSPDVTAYRLYHTTTMTNPWPIGWDLVVTKTNVVPSDPDLTIVLTNLSLGSHRWVLTAVTAYDVESDPSNEASIRLEKPTPPWGLQAGSPGTTTVLSRSLDLQTWEPIYTWTDSTNSVAFFRLEMRNAP
jgi:hypothetical protein